MRTNVMNDKKKWDKTFDERLDVYYDELKWLYFELYNNDDQALNYFIEMLYSFYKNRSKDLKEMDEAIKAVQDENMCPQCGNSLIRRNGKHGEFWGCASFPDCRFTKDC